MDEEAIGRARARYAELRPQLEAYSASVASLIESLCETADLDVENVSHRTKTIESVVGKLRSHRAYTTLDDVTDKSGIRIITRYRDAVEPVCQLLRAEFTILEEVTHGGDSPQTFGYASRHFLIQLDPRRSALAEYAAFDALVAEVQVRSILQHAWALISHSLDYKSGIEIPEPVRRRLFRVAALLETGDEIFDTFVTEVAHLKNEYRHIASTDWHSLALDLDAAEAVWQRFPWNLVATAAEAAGWYPTGDIWTWDAPPDEVDREALRILVQAAGSAGFTTWGQLAMVAEHMTDFVPFLQSRSDMFAIPPHVLSVVLSNGEMAERARVVAGVDEPNDRSSPDANLV